MSRSKYKIYNGKTLINSLENSRVYFLLFLLIIGLITGASIVKSDINFIKNITEIFKNYSFARKGQSFADNFADSFAINFIFMVMNIFFGFSVIGFPFLMLLPMLKGLGIGAMCGYLYSSFGFSGVGYSLLMIFPCSAVSSIALIYACNDSCEYSRNAWQKSLKGRGQYEKNETRVYLIRQLVFLAICFASSGIDALFCKLFSGLFKI